MATESKSILEVRVKFDTDSLLVEWGMQVNDHKWLFQYPMLEVRLYVDPFPDFGRPELMNSPLPDRSTTIGKSFGIPYTPFTIYREVAGPAFLPGTVFADADGKCYPVTLDLTPVSYTHLDVYKRQSLGRYSCLFVDRSGMLELVDRQRRDEHDVL